MNYLYKELSGQKSTEQIHAVDYTFGGTGTSFDRTYTYAYDVNGNITAINKNGVLNQGYVYDEAGQLIRVNDADKNKTTTYQYDAGGNIRAKKEYAYTTGSLGAVTSTINYTYGNAEWKDLLTAYNGKAITYDTNGNPLTYDGWTYTWEAGRQLKRMTKSGSIIDYKYDDSGIRTQKKVDNVTTNYTLIGGQITAQETGGAWTYFRHDESGELLSLNWDGNEYFYVKNIQGDVIGIVDASGNLVVEYTYDAWGAPVSVTGSMAATLGEANPFRYRGYAYDEETGLFYVGSRYYDPEIGRFINADGTEALALSADNVIGANLFAYCMNNPVNMIDEDGKAPKYINNQWDNSVKNIKWGLLGKTGPNGCGWISVYNVMASYSSKVTYQSVINGLTASGGVLALGKLGANPVGVTRYLKSKFWFVHNAGPITYLWGIKAELSGGVIVLYQHKGWNASLHYVAGIKTGGGAGGSFRFYNDSYYTKKYGSKSISIWQYIDLLKANGCKLIMFWGVSGKKGWW